MNRYHPLHKILACLLLTALLLFSFHVFFELRDLDRGLYPNVLREKDRILVVEALNKITSTTTKEEAEAINEELTKTLEKEAPLLIYNFNGKEDNLSLENQKSEDKLLYITSFHSDYNDASGRANYYSFYVKVPETDKVENLADPYYYNAYQDFKKRNDNIKTMSIYGGVSFLLSFALGLYLLTILGKRKEGAYPVSKVDRIPLEFLLSGYGLLAFISLFFGIQGYLSSYRFTRIYDLVIITSLLLVSFPLAELLMRRFHQGRLLKSSLLYRLFSKTLGVTKGTLRSLPLVWKSMGAALLYVFLSAYFLKSGIYSSLYMLFYYILQLVFLAYIAKSILGRRELRRVTADVASGNLGSKVDVDNLSLGLQEEGILLNQISDGIGLAVEERMKSENFKTELITNVSHDLKTPLTSIINYTDLLKKEGLDSASATEYLHALDRQSQRLKKLMDDLLQVSKATTGSMEVHLEKTNVKELLQQVAGEYQEKLEAQDLQLVLDLPEEELLIEADSSLIWRVLDNLLGNARKYSLSGTRVYVSAEKKRKTVRISIKNISKEKLGISAEELKQRFVRADSSRSSEGSGLGLAIAESLTQLQGGHLFLDIDGDLFKANLVFPEI